MPNKEKIFLGDKEFDSLVAVNVGKLRGTRRDFREAIDEAKSRAKDAIEESTRNGKVPFSFEAFEKKYLGEESKRAFLQFFERYIHRLSLNEQAGTARTYSSAYSAFNAFLNGREIDAAEITTGKLKEFDRWLRESHTVVKNGKKIKIRPKNSTSVSIYMRCLRTVYNELAEGDDYLESIYPFSRSDHDKKYRIPANSSGSKGDALPLEDMNKFIEGEVSGGADPNNPIYRAKQLFLFSFWAQGMNFKDMALLQYSNIKTDTIEFERQKTIRTKSGGRLIHIPLVDDIKSILVELGNSDKRKSSYVFEVLNEQHNKSEKKKDDAIRQWIKTTNKWLAKYCQAVGLPRVTTYWSRHTFAGFAKDLPTTILRDMFGHSRTATTEAYIKKRHLDTALREAHMKVTEGLTKKSA